MKISPEEFERQRKNTNVGRWLGGVSFFVGFSVYRWIDIGNFHFDGPFEFIKWVGVVAVIGGIVGYYIGESDWWHDFMNKIRPPKNPL